MFSLRSSTSRLLRPCIPSTASLQYGANARNYATEISKSPKSEMASAMSRTTSLFKTYKPVSPGIRHLRRPLNPHLWPGKPIRALTVALRKKGGRNSHGRVTVRSRGGGHKRRIRLVDFIRSEPGIHDVVRIEYDPGRSAHIALVRNRSTGVEGTKKWSYILAPEGLRAGHEVQSFRQGIPKGFFPGYGDESAAEVISKMGKGGEEDTTSEQIKDSSESLAIGILRARTIKPGNVLPLRLMPIGTVVHNVALKPNGPGILVRSAGTFGQVLIHEEAGRYSHVRMQSGEVRKVLSTCCATVGKVSNPLHKNRSLGKAGRSRWLGRRPHVRGVAMNKSDHPHGGGRGRSKSNKHPVSPWGWQTKGKRTRKPGPRGPPGSNKMVISERPRGKAKEKRSR